MIRYRGSKPLSGFVVTITDQMLRARYQAHRVDQDRRVIDGMLVLEPFLKSGADLVAGPFLFGPGFPHPLQRPHSK